MDTIVIAALLARLTLRTVNVENLAAAWLSLSFVVLTHFNIVSADDDFQKGYFILAARDDNATAALLIFNCS